MGSGGRVLYGRRMYTGRHTGVQPDPRMPSAPRRGSAMTREAGVYRSDASSGQRARSRSAAARSSASIVKSAKSNPGPTVHPTST